MGIFKRNILLLFIFGFVFISSASAQSSGFEAKERKIVYFKDYSFYVEVAKTKHQWEEGLMFIKSMPFNSGMLFIYKEEAVRSFYMKNTNIPLDIIWMDKDKKVVFIKKNAKPANLDSYEVIQPEEEAMFVLELYAGNADKAGLRIGDTLQF